MDSAGSADYYSLAADSDVCAGIQGMLSAEGCV